MEFVPNFAHIFHREIKEISCNREQKSNVDIATQAYGHFPAKCGVRVYRKHLIPASRTKAFETATANHCVLHTPVPCCIFVDALKYCFIYFLCLVFEKISVSNFKIDLVFFFQERPFIILLYLKYTLYTPLIHNGFLDIKSRLFTGGVSRNTVIHTVLFLVLFMPPFCKTVQFFW